MNRSKGTLLLLHGYWNKNEKYVILQEYSVYIPGTATTSERQTRRKYRLAGYFLPGFPTDTTDARHAH